MRRRTLAVGRGFGSGRDGSYQGGSYQGGGR